MTSSRAVASLGLSLSLLLGWHSHGRVAMRWLANPVAIAKPPVRDPGAPAIPVVPRLQPPITATPIIEIEPPDIGELPAVKPRPVMSRAEFERRKARGDFGCFFPGQARLLNESERRHREAIEHLLREHNEAIRGVR